MRHLVTSRNEERLLEILFSQRRSVSDAAHFTFERRAARLLGIDVGERASASRTCLVGVSDANRVCRVRRFSRGSHSVPLNRPKLVWPLEIPRSRSSRT